MPKPQAASNNARLPYHPQADKDARALLAASLIWFVSGTPVQIIAIGQDAWFIVVLILQVIICARRRVSSVQAAFPLTAVMGLYACWTMAASADGMSGQVTGLLGQLIRLTTVLLPIVFIRDLRSGLVQAMSLICKISLAIFIVRQVFLLFGFDIASVFQPLYDATGIANDRTIFLFNFDIPEEATRNSGPFREPGMFAANIVIAGLLLLSIKGHVTRRHVKKLSMLFGVTLLTTQSTMGLVALPFLGILALPIVIRRTASKILIIIGLVALTAGSIAIGGTSQIDKIQQQLELTSAKKNRWYNTRFGNAYIDYEAIITNPWIGHGFSEENRPTIEGVKEDVREVGLGNGLTGTIVKHGLIFSILLYMFFLVRSVWLFNSVTRGIIAWIVLGLILFSQQLILFPAIFTTLGSYRNLRDRFNRQRSFTLGSGDLPLEKAVS